MIELVPIALLGGLLGLDVVSFPQMMFSRPIVAATIAGAMAGDTYAGMMAGAALELIALATLPFGASRYPEWGSASVVGGAIAASLGSGRAGGLTIAVLAALATAWVGGLSLVQLRVWIASVARKRRQALDAGSRGAVMTIQLAGLTADFIRGAVLSVVAFAALWPVSRATIGVWSFSDSVSRAFIVTLSVAVTCAAAWVIFHSARGARWFFAAGLLLGGIALLVR
jgi:mannose/fructose/N-acetylgalactosamine-specific phosphotransferase system component IIC